MGVSHFRVRPGHSFPWVLPVSRRALGGVLQSVPPTHPKMFRKESVGVVVWSQIGLIISLKKIILEEHFSIKSTEKAFSEDTVPFWETG